MTDDCSVFAYSHEHIWRRSASMRVRISPGIIHTRWTVPLFYAVFRFNEFRCEIWNGCCWWIIFLSSRKNNRFQYCSMIIHIKYDHCHRPHCYLLHATQTCAYIWPYRTQSFREQLDLCQMYTHTCTHTSHTLTLARTGDSRWIDCWQRALRFWSPAQRQVL